MISVCIATYNGEKYIKQQLQSILDQLSESDEVIISDDDSTDSTLSLIASFNDSRIHVYHHDPTTVATTFLLDRATHNFGNALMQANGDIIFLSDQDDVWSPNKVSVMCEALTHASLAVHDCKVFNDTMDQLIEPSYFKYRGVHKGIWHNFYKASYLGCCMAMKREVVTSALPFPPTKVGHDLWLGLVADRFYSTVLVDECLVSYRKHSCSKTTSGTRSTHSFLFKVSYRFTILYYIIRLYFR